MSVKILFLDQKSIRVCLIFFWILCIFFGVSTSWYSEAFVFFILGLAGFYQMCRSLVFLWGHFRFHKIYEKSPEYSTVKDWPQVDILVPCFNEESSLGATLTSLLKLDYPHFKIFVINDGSTDATQSIAEAWAARHSSLIKTFSKENSGKAASLDFGISQSDADYVLCVDADTRIHPMSLKRGMLRFLQEPHLHALAGVVEVSNSKSLIGQLQRHEYFVGNLQKATLSLFHKINVVPGPIGLFHKQSLIDIGGYYHPDVSFAEDAEVTLKLLAAEKPVAFEPGMISSTEVPEDDFNLLKQRYRWVRGTYQAVFKVLPSLLSSSRKETRFLGYFLFSEQIITTALEVGVLLLFLARLLLYGKITLLSSYFMGLVALEFIMGWVALRSSERFYKIVQQVLISRLAYSSILLFWKVFAIFEEWKSLKMDWDKVARYGSGEIPAPEASIA